MDSNPKQVLSDELMYNVVCIHLFLGGTTALSGQRRGRLGCILSGGGPEIWMADAWTGGNGTVQPGQANTRLAGFASLPVIANHALNYTGRTGWFFRL
jgi:hypothetical protein